MMKPIQSSKPVYRVVRKLLIYPCEHSPVVLLLVVGEKNLQYQK